MNPDDIPATPLPSAQSLPVQQATQTQPENNSLNSKTHTNPFAIIGVVLLIVVVGMGSYMLGATKNKTVMPLETQSPTPKQTEATPVVKENNPSQSSQSKTTSPFGYSSLSYTNNNGELLLRLETKLGDSKVAFPNSEIRAMTQFFSQDDKSLEPQELKNIDVAKYEWTDLVQENINDSKGSKSILIYDRLMSLKTIPSTSDFVFVVEWSRSAGQNTGSWSPYQSERVLYFYNTKLNKLSLVKTFPEEKNKYTYPKASLVSDDGRYMSFNLFGCWNCGGHMPETLLLDTKTLTTKNIGKVIEFAWKQDGAYQFKDYVVIDCKEPQPGECTQDATTLPVKSGKI